MDFDRVILYIFIRPYDFQFYDGESNSGLVGSSWVVSDLQFLKAV